MRVMDAAKIRLADVPPPACASCFGQYPDRQHVDMGAVFDGPVLNQGDVIVTGMTNVQIDDLVLCDECVRAAAALLGLVDPASDSVQLQDAMARIDELSERLAGALALLDAKEKAEGKRVSLLAEIRGK